MSVSGFDHVALPTAQPEALLAFYGRLGFDCPSPEAFRESGLPFFSIHFGHNKINVHTPTMWENPDFELRGPTAQPGCGDLCFVWDGSLESVQKRLAEAEAPIVAGPVELHGGRDGGRSLGTSVYTRDPDGNLLEFIVYPTP